MSLKISKIINVKGLNLSEVNYDEKIGLIYGVNGSGKSTIKYTLNTLTNRNSKIIKHFESYSDDTNIHVELNDKEYIYEGSSWNKEFKNTEIKIFDIDYVHNNIYVDGKLSSSIKENLPTIIFGEDNIKKYKKVESFEKKISDAKIELKEKINNTIDSDNNKLLVNLLTTLNKIKQILQTKYYFKNKLEKDGTLTNHLNTCIKNTEKSYLWLKEGLIHKTRRNNCPMCGQVLTDKEKQLFSEIEKYKIIDDGYEKTENDLNYYINTFNVYLNKLPTEVSIGNVEHIKNAIKYLYNEKSFDWRNNVEIISNPTLRNLEIRLNDYKERRNIIVKSKDNDEILESIDYLRTRNIDTFKSQRKLISSIKSAEIKKETLNIEVKNTMKDALLDRIKYINEELSYLSFPYVIDINKTLDNLEATATKTKQTSRTGLYLMYDKNKEHILEKDIPNTLSQGEKEVLAWVLFKNQIINSSSTKHQLIILDDPIASFDEHKRFSVITGIREFTKVNSNTVVLVLTHNKSMVTAFNTSFNDNTYRLKGKELVKVNIDELIKNEYNDNLREIIRINDSMVNEDNLIEFLVRSRNLIEMKIKSTLNENDESSYKTAFARLSRVIHMTSRKIPGATFETIEKIIKHHKNDFVINLNEHLDMDNINLLEIASNNIESIYSQRILLEDFLRNKVYNRFYNDLIINGNITAGRLFQQASKQNNLSKKEYKKIKSILPILNIINHSDGIYGQSINDLEDWQLELVKRVTRELVE